MEREIAVQGVTKNGILANVAVDTVLVLDASDPIAALVVDHVAAGERYGCLIRELRGGTGSYNFDYPMMAVRKGYEDFEVIRASSEAQAVAVND